MATTASSLAMVGWLPRASSELAEVPVIELGHLSHRAKTRLRDRRQPPGAGRWSGMMNCWRWRSGGVVRGRVRPGSSPVSNDRRSGQDAGRPFD
jgi:hypothetical protein